MLWPNMMASRTRSTSAARGTIILNRVARSRAYRSPGPVSVAASMQCVAPTSASRRRLSAAARSGSRSTVRESAAERLNRPCSCSSRIARAAANVSIWGLSVFGGYVMTCVSPVSGTGGGGVSGVPPVGAMRTNPSELASASRPAAATRSKRLIDHPGAACRAPRTTRATRRSRARAARAGCGARAHSAGTLRDTRCRSRGRRREHRARAVRGSGRALSSSRPYHDTAQIGTCPQSERGSTPSKSSAVCSSNTATGSLETARLKASALFGERFRRFFSSSFDSTT